MAFSTQKDFFHVPFMNENLQYECKKVCVKLKSYESSIDNRSWTRDETKMSQFLSDLVTCQFPVRGLGEGDDSGHTTDMPFGPFRGDATNRPGLVSSASHDDTVNSVRSVGDKIKPAVIRNELFNGGDRSINPIDGGLKAGDSLLECGNMHLADYQKILNIKVSLEKQLNVSNERLKTASEENRKIKEILASKLDANMKTDFYNKIQILLATGKLTKNEENEMLQIHQKMEDMHKIYEVLQAENTYLKCLIEKLSSRITMDQIKTELETSSDVDYLRKEVNTMRKECIMLRAIEDDYLKIKHESRKRTMSDQDADNIKSIINERNSLREKCTTFRALENMYKESDKVNSRHINDMECEIQKMQRYYVEELQQACFREQCLKKQLEDLKGDIVRCKYQTEKAEMLKKELACLHYELSKRDMALSDYDCQYKQLMGVVTELQAIKLQCLQDNHTQTCKNQTDDLAYFTCATLDEITKEVKRKRYTKDDFDSEYYAYGLGHGGSRDEEISRLHKESNDMKAERDNTCADALKRLKELETENVNLLSENFRIRELMKEGEVKMANMLKKIEHLDLEINKNADELRRSNNQLADTKKLVEDISNIHLQNQQLVNAVNAINSRDDEKIIDDLRRQLDEEMSKLKKCQLDNVGLVHRAVDRENELKSLKDVNKKMQRDINQLESENRKLKDDNASLIEEIEHRKLGVGNGEIGNFLIVKDDHKVDEHIFNKIYIGDKAPKIPSYGSNVLTNEAATIKGHFDDFVSSKPNEAQAVGSVSLYKTQLKTSQSTTLRDKEISKEAQTLETFIHKKATNLKSSFNEAQDFETELRKIFDEFIQECGFCFSRLANPKCKLYAISHKLNQCGINALSLRELAYMHKKIYEQAEQRLPGFLLDMIITDHMEEVRGILKISGAALPRISAGAGGGVVTDNNCSETARNVLQKCCSCKSELCCSKSEEMLKEKVIKLEKDIEIVREYLDSLKTLPLVKKSESDFTEMIDHDSTYRAISPIQKISSKHFKKLKTRVLKKP